MALQSAAQSLSHSAQTQPSQAALPLEQHSLPKTIALHLAPGAIFTLVYTLLAQPMQRLGFNNLLTFNLLAVLLLVPLELGILFVVGKQQSGRFTLQGVVLNRQHLPLWQLLGLALLTLVYLVLCFTQLQTRLDPWLQKTVFGWVPEWFMLMHGLDQAPRNLAILTILVSMVCTSWIAPFVEEYYFRGYLLPRLASFGSLAPFINAVLFSLYHFFTPWQALTRIIALAPMAWLVQRKRNLYISIIAHILLNTLSLLPTLIALLK
jgi:membrane protease YdiL (CAAX protease family)